MMRRQLQAPQNETAARSKFLFRILLFVFLVTLQACDGCQNRVTNSVASGSGDGRPLEGKPDPGTYYRVVPGFKCSNQPHVHSQLDVTSSSMSLSVFNASDCVPVKTDLQFSSVEHSQFSNDLIGLKDAIFVRQVTPPDPAHPTADFPEVWCRSALVAGSVLDLSIVRDPVSSDLKSTLTGSKQQVTGEFLKSPTEIQTVSRAVNSTDFVYASPTGTLSSARTLNSLGVAAGRFAGVYASSVLDLPLNCRFAQAFDPVASPAPTFAFDFLSGALPSILSFQRSGTASYFNETGLIAISSPNTPRFDFEPTTHASLGLLLEEARTNVFLQSTDLTAAPWVAAQFGVFKEGQIAGLDRYRLQRNDPTATEYWRRVLQQVTLTAGQTYTASFFVQRGNQNSALVTVWQTATDEAEVLIDLTTGVTSTRYQSGVTILRSTVTRVGAAFRVSVTFIPSIATLDVGIGPDSTTLGDYVYATGAQLELGAGPSSLILSTTAPASRGEDLAQINSLSWFNAPTGTLSVDVSRVGSETGGSTASSKPFMITGGGSDEISLTYSASANSYRSRMSVSSQTSDWAAVSSPRSGSSALQSLFLSYEAGGASLQLNSVITHDPASSPAGLSPTAFTLGGSAAVKWNGHFRSFTYWPRRLSDAEMQSISH